MAATKVTLVTNKICPFAQRAWLALEEMGVDYDLKETPLGTPASGGAKPAWFTEIYRSAMGADVSSDGKVPVLQDSSLTLTESAVIVDYVASKYRVEGKTDILPATPLDRAKALLFQDQVIGKVVPSFYAALKATSESEEVQAKTKESWLAAVATLSKALEANGGPFVLGQHMTVPDLLVWPFVQRFVTLKHYRGLEVPSTPEYAAFHRWVSACKARKSVQATGMPDEYFVEGYKFYAYPPK